MSLRPAFSHHPSRPRSKTTTSRQPRRTPTYRLWGLFWLGLWATSAMAMGLSSHGAAVDCGVLPNARPTQTAPPAAATQRLPDSQLVPGAKDLSWVWLASPTRRYPHTALGSPVHAGSVHALAALPGGGWREVAYELPLQRVFEDRVPRLVDLDGDGRDELLLIESDLLQGAALVVLGLRGDGSAQAPLKLVELARGPAVGSTFRWLNPVGVADFDGDGHLDVASITTPHVGGMLFLYHYRPPLLEPFAKAMDVSNHRMGALEQGLAVIVQQAGKRPTVVVPDMSQRALHALRWEAPGQWKELADLMPMAARAERLTPLPDGACVGLSDGSWARVTLTP